MRCVCCDVGGGQAGIVLILSALSRTAIQRDLNLDLSASLLAILTAFMYISVALMALRRASSFVEASSMHLSAAYGVLSILSWVVAVILLLLTSALVSIVCRERTLR